MQENTIPPPSWPSWPLVFMCYATVLVGHCVSVYLDTSHSRWNGVSAYVCLSYSVCVYVSVICVCHLLVYVFQVSPLTCSRCYDSFEGLVTLLRRNEGNIYRKFILLIVILCAILNKAWHFHYFHLIYNHDSSSINLVLHYTIICIEISFIKYLH